MCVVLLGWHEVNFIYTFTVTQYKHTLALHDIHIVTKHTAKTTHTTYLHNNTHTHTERERVGEKVNKWVDDDIKRDV